MKAPRLHETRSHAFVPTPSRGSIAAGGRMAARMSVDDASGSAAWPVPAWSSSGLVNGMAVKELARSQDNGGRKKLPPSTPRFSPRAYPRRAWRYALAMCEIQAGSVRGGRHRHKNGSRVIERASSTARPPLDFSRAPGAAASLSRHPFKSTWRRGAVGGG